MADVAVSVVMERSRMLADRGLARGAEKELFRIIDVLKTIQNVVDDAEKRRFTEKAVEDWLSMLEQTCHRFEEVLDEWEYAVLKQIKDENESYNDDVVSPHEQKKVCSFTRSSCLSFRKSGLRSSHLPVKEIQKFIAQVDQISEARHEFNFVVPESTAAHARQVQSTSPFHQEALFGRERDRKYLVDKLVSVVYQQLHLQILSLVGMGGIGKTALAQLVYNDSRVEACFDVRIWICVSDPFDEIRIAKQIIETVGKVMNKNHSDLVFEQLTDCISREVFLLVLDGVWTMDYDKWRPLKDSLGHGRAGSMILVTTRNETVAEMMGTEKNDVYHVGPISDDACWLLLSNTLVLVGNEEPISDDAYWKFLFSALVLVDNEEKLTIFENIGKEMAKKCKGLPFALKTLGSILRCKNTLEEWESVLREETWELISEDFLPLLLPSYNEFPLLRHCFSYCSVFPKDSWIEVEKLIQIWIALGYLGSGLVKFNNVYHRGRDNFDILATHSLFQDLMRGSDGQIKRCKMNGIIHDFAQFLRRRRTTGTKKTTCQVCDPLVIYKVEVFRSLFLDSDSSLNICGCLKSLRVLKITSKLQRIPREMEKLINLTWLELGGNKLSREEAKTICKLYKLQFLSFCVDEVPWEIGNLLRLRLLDLSHSGSLTELPDSIRNLRILQTLNISFCPRLSKLPEAVFDWLVCLVQLLNSGTTSLKQLPEGNTVERLLTLSEYRGGSGRSKLRWLKRLNQLRGSLSLKIRLADDDDLAEMVEDAKEAKLMNKKGIRELEIIFEDEMDETEETVKARVDVLDALKPTEDLQELHVWFYYGSSLPDWITSHVRMLRSVKLYSFNHLSSLPPLGKLPHLEEIYMAEMHALQFVGREFLGITATRRGGSFPSLKELTFNHCPQWNEWEDISYITEEEEESARLIMPRLEKLTIVACPLLNALPRRLLGKLPSSLKLNIMCCSTNLQQYSNYRDHASSSQLMQS